MRSNGPCLPKTLIFLPSFFFFFSLSPFLSFLPRPCARRGPTSAPSFVVRPIQTTAPVSFWRAHDSLQPPVGISERRATVRAEEQRCRRSCSSKLPPPATIERLVGRVLKSLSRRVILLKESSQFSLAKEKFEFEFLGFLREFGDFDSIVEIDVIRG